MSDKQKGPKRPVREAPRGAQRSLFGEESTQPGNRASSSRQGERRFVEPDPEEITVGGEMLGEYLEQRDQQWVLVMRERLREVDWDDWEARYEGGGRPPYHPAPMLGLVMYGVVEGNDSLRALEKCARTDLGCMWLTGGIQPDHATIGRFICRHADQLQGEGFRELTRAILEVVPKVDREVAGDGTTVEAVGSEVSRLEKEAAEQWAANHQEESGQPRGQKGQRAEKLMGEIERRTETRRQNGNDPEETKFSTTEPEAVWHRHKHGGWKFGYVPSLMVNRQRFIVGQSVDRSSEPAQVEKLLDDSEKILGELGEEDDDQPAVERVMLDNNYYALGVLEEVVGRQLDTLIYPDRFEPESLEEWPRRGGKFAKEAFDYHSEEDVLECPAGQKLPRKASGTDRLGNSYRSYGRADACENCPLREECTDSKEGRTVKRYEQDRLKESMRRVMAQPRAREAYSRRMGMVEPVFGDIAGRGFRRNRRRGLRGAATDWALQSLGHNFKRLKTYVDSGRVDTDGVVPRTGSYTEHPPPRPSRTPSDFGVSRRSISPMRPFGPSSLSRPLFSPPPKRTARGKFGSFTFETRPFDNSPGLMPKNGA